MPVVKAKVIPKLMRNFRQKIKENDLENLKLPPGIKQICSINDK